MTGNRYNNLSAIIKYNFCLCWFSGNFYRLDDMFVGKPDGFKVRGRAGWKEENAFFGVDWNGDFLVEVGVMGDGTAPPVICIPFVVASCFDDLKRCFSNVHFFVLLHHNGVILNTSCGDKCHGVFMNYILRLYLIHYWLLLRLFFSSSLINSINSGKYSSSFISSS